MSRKLISLAIVCWLLLLCTTAAAQHLVDPHFDARVENPAYSKNFPRVLFDEAHYNIDTINNRYKPFADLLFNDGFQVAVNRQPFSKEVLKTFKVVVIANALGSEDVDDETATAAAFTTAEIDALYDWVKDGGALLLITNAGPFGAASQTLATKFGIELSKSELSTPDAVKHLESVFSRENKLLAEHLITNGRGENERVNVVMTFNALAVKGPTGSAQLLQVSSDQEGTKTLAGWSQGVAFRLEKGRVVALGDSAMLSAQLTGREKKPFGMNIPEADNKQFTLNTMRWLSGWLK